MPTFLNGNHWALIIVDYCSKRFVTIDPLDIQSNIDQLQSQPNKKPVNDYALFTVKHTRQTAPAHSKN